MHTILHTESSVGWGGQEIRIVQESAGISRRGDRVIIAAPVRSNIFRRAQEAGLQVMPAEFSKKNPLSVIRMSSIIDKIKPDIINTHSSSDSWVSTIASKLSKTVPKIIRTRHLSAAISRSYSNRLIYNSLPDAIITTGEEIRQMMIHKSGFAASKIVSIPTGIDVERFNPAKVKPAYRASGLAVGMIGVLRSWKGHNYFIDSMPKILERIPDAFFYIVGDGPQRKHLDELVSKLSFKDRIVFLGHREDIPEIMASLDIIVHPSYANEGVPQTLLQALAMEKAVVASDAGAIKEIIIDRKTGFLIEPRNSGQIAERVTEFFNNPELRSDFGKQGRQLVERSYSLESMLNNIDALYRKLLDNA
jgi:glycosyltransferase involved in cell wall biosynthesis